MSSVERLLGNRLLDEQLLDEQLLGEWLLGVRLFGERLLGEQPMDEQLLNDGLSHNCLLQNCLLQDSLLNKQLVHERLLRIQLRPRHGRSDPAGVPMAGAHLRGSCPAVANLNEPSIRSTPTAASPTTALKKEALPTCLEAQAPPGAPTLESDTGPPTADQPMTAEMAWIREGSTWTRRASGTGPAGLQADVASARINEAAEVDRSGCVEGSRRTPECRPNGLGLNAGRQGAGVEPSTKRDHHPGPHEVDDRFVLVAGASGLAHQDWRIRPGASPRRVDAALKTLLFSREQGQRRSQRPGPAQAASQQSQSAIPVSNPTSHRH